MNLYGGTIRFDDYERDEEGAFNYVTGTIQLAGDRQVGTDQVIDELYGAAPTLPAGKGLTVEDTATLLTPVTLDGGTFSAGRLVNEHFLVFNAGTFNLTGDDLLVSPGGLFGPSLIVAAGQTINVTNTTTISPGSFVAVVDGASFSTGTLANNGEITLAGYTARVDAGALNNAGLLRGEGRVGGPVTNTGSIEAFDQLGELVFNGPVTNEAAGLVAMRNAAMRFNAGLVNQGQVSIGPGTADLFGYVTNDNTISLASGATASVVGDLVQNATLNLLGDARMIVFNDLSGGGGSTGPGTLEVLGTVSPGSSPAEVTFGGDLVLGEGVLVELAGTAPGEFDRLVVAGELTLDGELDVVLFGGFVPALGDEFDVLDWGALDGTFDDVSLPTLGDFRWDTSQLYTEGVVALVSGLPGDYNGDGMVDAADYTVWRDHLGEPDESALGGNGTGTGGVDEGDYTLWKNNFGAVAGTGSGAVVSSSSGTLAVPEPATIVLLVIGVLAVAWRRARR